MGRNRDLVGTIGERCVSMGNMYVGGFVIVGSIEYWERRGGGKWLG